MMVNIGYLAKTFGLLPSQVLANANTYDLMIADVLGSWEEYQYNKAAGKSTVPDYSTEELASMMAKVRQHEPHK
jgi:hypothetical protein